MGHLFKTPFYIFHKFYDCPEAFVKVMFISAPSGKYCAIGKCGLKGSFSIFFCLACFMEN